MTDAKSRMHYFVMLTPEEQRAAILRLIDSGMSETCVASATRLSVEFVRKIVGSRDARAA